MRMSIMVLGLSVLMTATSTLRAEVVEQSETHFVVRNQVTIDAPAPRVFRAMTADIGRWWDPAHTYFGSAEALSFEPRVGGCFCERTADGRGVEHLRVVYADPGRQIRLTGALGPLQELAVTGVATWTLSQTSSGTTVELVYKVAGHRSGGLGAVAGAVDGVLADQLARLKAYVDSAERRPPSV